MKRDSSFINQQLFPISLTLITYVVLGIALLLTINVLNAFPIKQNILLSLRWQDILVGVIIYIKSSIDFALFIGNLMSKNRGVKNRIAIEIGTQIGNGIGTFLILVVWYFFKEVPALLALMIFVASVVLFAMAEEGIEELFEKHKQRKTLTGIAKIIYQPLKELNRLFRPINKIILPKSGNKSFNTYTFFGLLLFSITIPFILGLDDFAGYIPLFSLVNVFGFAIGVLTGHMLLLTFLFLSQEKTSTIVRHPFVMLFGNIAFVGIAGYGLIEVISLILQIF